MRAADLLRGSHWTVYLLVGCDTCRYGLAVRKSLISLYSASDMRKLSAAATPSTCFALRPPTIAAVMARWCSVHAIAMTPAETLCRPAIDLRKSAMARLRESCGSW